MHVQVQKYMAKVGVLIEEEFCTRTWPVIGQSKLFWNKFWKRFSLKSDQSSRNQCIPRAGPREDGQGRHAHQEGPDRTRPTL
jgi:hypothetical protein